MTKKQVSLDNYMEFVHY